VLFAASGEKLAEIGKSAVNLIEAPAVCGGDVVILRPDVAVDSRFLGFACDSPAAAMQKASMGRGTTVKHIYPDELRQVLLAFPPLAEQRAIAAFLDRETKKIDELVAEQERLIELLKEKRQAVISHAVTKGLDPAAPMKPSGVEWLGDVPAHWEVKPLMRLTPDDRQIMYGIVLPGPDVDEGVPIVKGGDVAPGRLTLAQLKKTTFEIEAGYARSRLAAGDIVYSIRGSIGDAELVPAEIAGANVTQDAARIAPRVGVHGAWLLWAMRSSGVFGQLDAFASGATIRGINIFALKRARIPVPPLVEQAEIADAVHGWLRSIDCLSASAESAISLLTERRSALISAAVTGQIDVRNAVPSATPTEAA
jgi:type I restriction enzyme S subunit